MIDTTAKALSYSSVAVHHAPMTCIAHLLPLPDASRGAGAVRARRAVNFLTFRAVDGD
jgi:hypothetical protein